VKHKELVNKLLKHYSGEAPLSPQELDEVTLSLKQILNNLNDYSQKQRENLN
jgi:hypothetical protein